MNKYFKMLLLFFAVNLLNVNNLIDAKTITQSYYDSINRFAQLSLENDRVNGLNYLNELRNEAGLNSLTENIYLDNSAQNHADYLAINNIFSHYEDTSMEGFTGVTPYDRAQYAGYTGFKVSENISAGDSDIYESIDNLFSAIYHRFGFLDLNINEIGIGEDYSETYAYKTVFVYNMGNNLSYSDKSLYNKNPEYVLWPYKDASNISPVFYDEVPDPLPQCNVTGYPVSVEFNPEKIDINSFSFISFELYDNENNKINATILTYETDPNNHLSQYQFALMPLERLKWGTKYNAIFKYKENNETKTIEWSFTTKKLSSPYYEVKNSNETFNIKPNQTYIIYFPPNNCNDRFNSYSASYSGNEPQLKFVDFNTLEVFSSAAVGNFIKINTSNGKTVTLKLSDSDSAIYPLDETNNNCSINNIDYCSNETECESVGGYWYDNKCNVQPQPSTCSSDSLDLCESEEECIAAGGYWYNDTCNTSPEENQSINNAYPAQPLKAIEFAFGVPQPNAADNIVNIPPSSSTYLQPSIYVDEEDVGKEAVLVMYIYLNQSHTGFMLPAKKVTLASIQKFTNLPNALDFSKADGMSFDVYFGYRIGTTLKYNNFRVNVVEKVDVPDCSKGSDIESCNSINGCIALTDFFGNFNECSLNCMQFTSNSDCENAFDGNSCVWNDTFGTCNVK